MLLFSGAYFPDFGMVNGETPEKIDLEAFYTRCVEHADQLFKEDAWSGIIDNLVQTYGGFPEAEGAAFYILGATSMAESIKEGRFEV